MKEKLSLKSIKNVLSRAEMKMIMAGSGDCGTSECSSDTDCKDSRYPKCDKTTCLSTGKAFNFCIP